MQEMPERFDPWVGKMTWRGAWQPTPVFLPRGSHGQRNLVGCIVHGVAKSQTRLSNYHFHFPLGQLYSTRKKKKKWLALPRSKGFSRWWSRNEIAHQRETSSGTESTPVRQDILVCQEERKLLKTIGLMAKWPTGYCEGAPLIQVTAVEASKNRDLGYIHTGNMKMH